MKVRLEGPGIYVELDSDEIYPEDPGMGTPAMVHQRGNRDNAATYWCAVNTGELSLGREVVQLTETQMQWLDMHDDIIADWIAEHTKAHA